jgi:hypothetical protein
MVGVIRFAVITLILLYRVFPGYTQSAVMPVPYTSPGSVYTQDFNGLPGTGSFSFTGKGPFNLGPTPISAANCNGWQAWMKSGSNTNLGFAISTGSSTGSNVYSLGSTASTDRALGTLASGTGIYSVGIILTNQTGISLNRCTISFTIEQWRKGGSGNTNTWNFQYGTGVINRIDQAVTASYAELDMKSVISTLSAASLNGNFPENRKAISFTLQNIHWKNGEQLLLRWDDADETGSDDACGIDDFSFSAQQVITAPLATSLPATGILSTSAILNGKVNDRFGNTKVWFAYDTSVLFMHPDTISAVPDTVYAGTGDTIVSAVPEQLRTGATYYYRISAMNTTGVTSGSMLSFTTAFSPPEVITDTPADIGPGWVTAGGRISSTGGTIISEKGIIWSLTATAAIADHTVPIENGSASFFKKIEALPTGAVIYIKAYAINGADTGYGNLISFSTATTILSLSPIAASLTNAAAVHFSMRTATPVSGLSAMNFSIVTQGISGTSVTATSSSSNSFTITVHTGSGDGDLSLNFINDTGLSVPVYNKPFTSAGNYTIDKSPPSIRSVSIPDKPMKLGDTIPVTILVLPDTEQYRVSSCKVNGINATGFRKINDSMYTAVVVIAGSTDIAAPSPVATYIVLKDSAGNSNQAYQEPIIQSSDLIDVIKPSLSSVQLPANGLYKAGDTLDFVFRFSEKIILSGRIGSATVSVTIGTRSKPALYVSGNGTDNLLYRYIIQPGESDKDGIRFTSSLTFHQVVITDIAGNPLVLNYTSPASAKIMVDAVIPVIGSVSTPLPGVYKTANILDFTVQFSKAIWLDTLNAVPFISVIIGNTVRSAYYNSGSGGTSLLFRYSIQEEDMDKDGIKLGTHIDLTTARLRDEAGNPAVLQLNGIGALSNILINPPTIAITGMILPADGVYRTGDTLGFAIQFNETVLVNTAGGIPSLRFTAGNTLKQAWYISGSGSTELWFTYAVQPGDLDSNGIVIISTIAFNNGAVKDERGNNIPVFINNIPSATGIRIDAVPPVIRSVLTPPKNTYRKNDTLDFLVIFSEKVFTGDSLFLNLQVGETIRKSMYTAGSGTNELLFRYIVQTGDNDKNGIKIDSMILPGDGLLQDLAGNPAIPVLKNIAALSGIRIITTVPRFITGDSRAMVCANTPVAIHMLLQVKYEEDDEIIVWELTQPPQHGSVSAVSGTLLSNGGVITPEKMVYTPVVDYAGQDSMIVQLGDSSYFIQKTIYITLQPPVTDNRISSDQIVCTTVQPAILTGTYPSGGDDKYAFTWETSVSSDTADFKPAPGTNNRQQYTPEKLNTDTWFRRKLVSGMCTDLSHPIKITVIKTGIWTGGFDTEWNNPNNWCALAIPSAATDVLIDGNALFQPIIRDSASCRHLRLLNNAHIIITAHLKLAGEVQRDSGIIDATRGRIIYSGNTLQTIASSVFANSCVKDLVIQNPAGVAINQSLIITGTLSLQSGILSTNNYLRLSDSAVIGPSAENSSIAGNISIAHLVSGGRKAFRLIGHPFTTGINFTMIKDSIDIIGEGGTANGFVATAFNQSSAFVFDPASANDSIGVHTGWKQVTHISDNWKECTGIRLLVQGKPGQGLDGTPAGDGTNGTYLPAPVQLLFTGAVRTGSLEINLQKKDRPAYHVIANPYPASIDLSRIARGNGIAASYWLWDPWQGTSGGYTGIRAKDITILPPFGAFLVRVNENAGNQLLFTENCKTGSQPATTPDGDYMELELRSGKIYWDKIRLFAVDSARIYFDGSDAEKFSNGEVNFYSISRDKKRLSIDARPINNTSVIPIGLETNLQQSFSIKITGINMPADNTLQLHDRYLEKWMSLEKDSSYSFTVTTDTLSRGDQRFEISTYRKPVDTASTYKLISTIYPVPARDKIIVNFKAPLIATTSIRILSQNGYPLKQLNLGMRKDGQITIPIPELSPGIYIVTIQCGEYSTTQKIIRQ